MRTYFFSIKAQHLLQLQQKEYELEAEYARNMQLWQDLQDCEDLPDQQERDQCIDLILAQITTSNIMIQNLYTQIYAIEEDISAIDTLLAWPDCAD